MSSRQRVLVIGGGLAGIAASLDCADAGASVTLLEVRPRLGGAAYSFEREGLRIDNGQHVFMRCCTAYRALLERIGSAPSVSIQPRLRVPVLSPGSPPAVIARGALPAPLHLAATLARYRYLKRLQRLGAARAALALRRLDPRDPALEGTSFGDWLQRHGQGPDAVENLWEVIVRPTLNVPTAEASLALGAFTFRTALLTHADAGDIGFHNATLSATIGQPAELDLDARLAERPLGWLADRRGQGRVVKTDVAGVCVGEQRGVEREGAECKRCLGGGQVQRRPHDHLPQVLDRVRTLAVALEPLAEADSFERRIARVQAPERQRRARGAEALAGREVPVSRQRPREVQRRR